MGDEIGRVRDERDEWRRRAEVAEAIAAERLVRAETAERALAAMGGRPATSTSPTSTSPTSASPVSATSGVAPDPRAGTPPTPPSRPRSLIERWRRYTETIN